MQLFGSSGIRMVAGRRLVELALQVGLAVGSRYRRVVVGSDTRTSGDIIRHALSAGLLAGGAASYDAGVVTTPTLALAGRNFDAAAMVTASHNPPEYNGIKLLNPDGSGFEHEQRQEIEAMVAAGSLPIAPWHDFKKSETFPGAIAAHIERICQDFPHPLKLKVVLDCGCGAGAMITPYLLQKMGCEVIGLNCYPSGIFPHDIEPVEANLVDLARATRELKADLGIAHDGDADRVMVIDDAGRFVSGDKLLVILSQAAGAKEIITTVDASMAIDELGMKVKRTRVGDVYVAEELRRGGDFGGEPSGAWIFPQVSYCPDGVYAAAKVLAVASERRLSEIVSRLPEYPLRRGSLSSRGIVLDKLKERLMDMDPVRVSSIDGIRLEFGSGWVLVRPSGTEPKIRITAEARTDVEVRSLYDRSVDIIKRCVEG